MIIEVELSSTMVISSIGLIVGRSFTGVTVIAKEVLTLLSPSETKIVRLS